MQQWILFAIGSLLTVATTIIAQLHHIKDKIIVGLFFSLLILIVFQIYVGVLLFLKDKKIKKQEKEIKELTEKNTRFNELEKLKAPIEAEIRAKIMGMPPNEFEEYKNTRRNLPQNSLI